MAVRKDCASGRGGYGYIPKNILDKVLLIKKKKKLKRNVDAWNRINTLIDIGSNVDDFYSGFFGVDRK